MISRLFVCKQSISAQFRTTWTFFIIKKNRCEDIMKFEKIWDVIDKFALSNGMSPSALAKSIGLDATTFNKSKRLRADGKQRWPSLESINKILEVYNIELEDLYRFSVDARQSANALSVPYISLSHLSQGSKAEVRHFDMASWKQVNLPYSTNNIYAIDLDNSAYEPLYNFGATLVVAKDSEIRRGDRVIIITRNGETLIREFIRREENAIKVCTPYDKETFQYINLSDIKLLNRIIWASQ